MREYPQQIISTVEKRDKISQSISKECSILRRTDLEDYLTPYDELDVELIREIDYFRMSANVFLCKQEELGLDNQIKHVNVVILEGENPKFTGDNEITKEQLINIQSEQKETIILGFKIKDIENIQGPYILGKGTKKEKKFNYNIKVEYDPLVLNCYHTESVIVCNESGDEITRGKIKSYREAISSDIKVKLMNKKMAKIYNYEDIA